MTDTCFIFKNFFSYDPVLKLPNNLPPNITPIYITDSINAITTAKELGWEVVYKDTYNHITDPFEKRKLIAEINCYPERFIDCSKYKFVYICDANVITLDSNYATFISNKGDKNALYLTSGWYSGHNNTMQKELERSLTNKRWSYNFNEIKHSVDEYHSKLTNLEIPFDDTPVISAKYIGWNISHSYKNIIADYVYNEYMKHLQGNIIFSMALKLYPDYICHYTGFKNDGCVLKHLITVF